MTYNNITRLFSKCFDILNIKYSIMGHSISIMDFIIFDILLFLILYWIFQLFHHN